MHISATLLEHSASTTPPPSQKTHPLEKRSTLVLPKEVKPSTLNCRIQHKWERKYAVP